MRNLKIRIKNVILTGVMAVAAVTASSCNPVTVQEATVAVSYTHLDVYKRQSLACRKHRTGLLPV